MTAEGNLPNKNHGVKKKMKSVKNLAAAALEFQRPSRQSPSKTSKKTGSKKISDPMPAHWVAALFAKLQALYGHRWTSAIDGIEEQAVAAWSETLSGITGEQIKAGLEALADEWPPSAPQFRLHCLYASGVPRPDRAWQIITAATYRSGTLRERYEHPAVLAAATEVDVYSLMRQDAAHVRRTFDSVYEALLQQCYEWPVERVQIGERAVYREPSPETVSEAVKQMREALRS